MLLHVVMFDFNPELDETKRQAILALSREALPKIPGVMNLMAGRNIRPDQEYPYAISMYFENQAALQVYRAHPAHEHFRDVEFFPYLGNKMSLDYED